MQEIDRQTDAEAYLKAFDERDLSQCLDFYDQDAVLHFMTGIYRGKEAIEEWHKDRFAADLRVAKLEDIEARDDAVIVHAIVTSKKLKAFMINKLGATVSLHFQDSKIKEARFQGRIGASTQIELRRM